MATRAILDSYDGIISALHQLHIDTAEKGETRNQNQAINILNKMEELEFMLMLYLWSYLLDEFHKTSQSLQDPQINLNVCRKLYASLSDFVKGSRDMFDHFEKKAKEKLPDVDCKKSKCRRRHINDDEDDALENLEPSDKFRIKTFIPVMDALESSLEKKGSVYNDAAKMFSFLTKLEATEEEIREGVSALCQTYPKDVDINLEGEVKHFHQYLRYSQTYSSVEQDCLTNQDLYRVTFNDRIQSTFPKVEAILRLFLSMMVANCSGERSFSQLKRIKNEFRTTMTQDKLCSLSLMCIESEKLCSLSFDYVINDFALEKARKRAF